MRFWDFKALSLQCSPFFSFCQFLITKLNNHEKSPFNRQSDIFIKNNELHLTSIVLTNNALNHFDKLKKNLSGLNLEIK